MNLSLALVKNAQQIMLRSFDNEEKAKLIPLTDISSLKIDALFIPKELSEEADIIALINNEASYCPIKLVSTEMLNPDSFDVLDSSAATTMFENLSHSWVLNNNITLLEKLIPTANHLKSLWPNDRTAFFEELWSLCKKNLGSHKLTIAYNHMRKAQKEGEKNQLIRVIVEGEKSPSPVENKELGETLFKNYENRFHSHLDFSEETQDQQLLLATINESPVIIMSNSGPISSLQKALLKALFDAVQI